MPDLSEIDDSIANGTYPYLAGEENPLALFTAPRTDYSLHRLRHYTGGEPGNFQNFVIFTNYQFYVDGKLGYTTAEGFSRRPEFVIFSSEVDDTSTKWAGEIPSGGYGGLNTSQTRMMVDYVRYYSTSAPNP